MKPVVELYFNAFANKDLAALDTLYDDNVILWEWGEHTFLGKDEVLQANRELFESANTMSIVVQKSAEVDQYSSFHELQILLDNKLITVIDVITVVNNKITNISAYRGFI